MLRTGASRLARRSIAAPRPAAAGVHRTCPTQWTSGVSSVAAKRPQLLPMAHLKPVQTAILRRTVAGKIDKEAENRYAHEKLKPTPETVSATSSVHGILTEVGTPNPVKSVKDADVMAGVKGDFEVIKGTFNLSDVPREAYYIGLAGVLPYLATSLSTVACAYEINNAGPGGSGYVVSAETAEALLHVLEPLQIGYGAVILSFLGAIHWGLEWAGFGGTQGYPRYAIGVFASAVAWPTVLLPVEHALITQFCAFVILYYVDTTATYRGWAPSWYAIYRFVLTFIVGASIVVSLIGRGEVAGRVKQIPGPVDRMNVLRKDAQEVLAEAEEGERLQELAKETAKEAAEGKKRAE